MNPAFTNTLDNRQGAKSSTVYKSSFSNQSSSGSISAARFNPAVRQNNFNAVNGGAPANNTPQSTQRQGYQKPANGASQQKLLSTSQAALSGAFRGLQFRPPQKNAQSSYFEQVFGLGNKKPLAQHTPQVKFPNVKAPSRTSEQQNRRSLNDFQRRQDNFHINFDILTKLQVKSKETPKQPSLMEYALERANEIRKGGRNKSKECVQPFYRLYSNEDVAFVTECQSNYMEYMMKTGMRYLQWQRPSDYIIKNPIPDDAVVAIIGDWGTGLQDAISLLEEAVLARGATIIIHLGDVYYSGLPQEMDKCVVDVLNALRKKSSRPIRYYSCIGNHEYYCGGVGFLDHLEKCNPEPNDRQRASYFCLRTRSGDWQFLGADTGYLDSNPVNELLFTEDPDILQKEADWLTDKIKNFAGSTVFLTHHQPYSATLQVTDLKTKENLNCYNPSLARTTFEIMPQLSAWFWGHQHTIYLYENGFAGLARGRLLGNSAFQIFTAEEPYTRQATDTSVPLLEKDETYFKKFTPDTVFDARLDKHFYDHTYAIIDLSRRGKHGEIPCEYYNVKSTYMTVPPVGKLWWREVIPKRDFTQIEVPANRAELTIKVQFGLYIKKSKDGYPELATRPTSHTIVKHQNKRPGLRHGDQVKIIALDPHNEHNSYLTAAWNGVYYTSFHSEPSLWVLELPDHTPGSTAKLNYKQTFYLKNRAYSDYLSDIGIAAGTNALCLNKRPYKLMCFMVTNDKGQQMYLEHDCKLSYAQKPQIEDSCLNQ